MSFIYIQQTYLLSKNFILLSSRCNDTFNNNWVLHIKLAKGSMDLMVIPSLRVSFLLNPKLVRNVPYAFQITPPNFPHFLAFFHGLGPYSGAKIKVQI